jgi:RNA polymerase sigma factor (sigma-70 family)
MIISFEERLPVIYEEINKRQNKWTFTKLDFDDVRQKILIRVFNKYHLFDDKKGKFTHWLNTVISSAIKNILRDSLTKYSRPCIVGCKFHLGGDSCGYTKSGIQCDECPLFKDWRIRKQDHFNVEQSLPLENHEQEVNNLPGDFINYEEIKKVLDKEMETRLKPFEYKIYHLLYIENKSPEEVGKILKYKKGKNSEIPGYQALRKSRKQIIKIAKEIIVEQGLA